MHRYTLSYFADSIVVLLLFACLLYSYEYDRYCPKKVCKLQIYELWNIKLKITQIQVINATAKKKRDSLL